MTLTLVVRATAQAEIEEAANWYEQREVDVGATFVAAVDATFDRMIAAPLQFPLIRDGEPFRRALVEHFPYHVFFEMVAPRLVVLAVAHERRRPGYWRARTRR